MSFFTHRMENSAKLDWDDEALAHWCVMLDWFPMKRESKLAREIEPVVGQREI